MAPRERVLQRVTWRGCGSVFKRGGFFERPNRADRKLPSLALRIFFLNRSTGAIYPPPLGADRKKLVEPSGIEPLTSTMPL